ncbi:tetratricopeptide repeat protein [Hansschlegelia sp. KR7-227]|uniref:tetratricopeptide repeat protein n=1 Tax=Hansschlegelia sp. KR7-227 TaxID=3400914 RepID=UPI003BFE815D
MIRCALSIALVVTLAGAPAFAQSPPPPEAGPAQPLVSEPAPAPDGQAAKPGLSQADGHAKAIDELLARLAKTDNPDSARRIAAAVQAMWSRSGSDTVDLLIARSLDAQRKTKLDVAVKLMDEAIGLRPDYAEGWNRRATLRFMAKDYDEAMADIHETLIREPRHFGAWMGLGRILQDSGFKAKALAAYRRALDIYPAIKGLKREVDDLALKVEGQPI